MYKRQDLPEQVRRASVAPRFFAVWAVAPALGRGLQAADHQEGAPPVVVTSDRYWRRRLDADPRVLDRTVRIRDQSFSIVGVLPASFRFPDRNVDLWFPTRSDRVARSRLVTWYIGVGRLKPAVTRDQARADLAVVQAQLSAQYPDTDKEIGVQILPLKETVVGGTRGSLWLLFGAVSALLLIACTNVAALLLARGTKRQQEIAVRASLGASRAAVTAQMLTETAVLAVAGALAGLLVAAGTAAALRTLPSLPRSDEITLDGWILLYTLGCAVAVALLCGVFPGLWSTRHGGPPTLADAGRAQVSTRHALQWLLVGSQMALSVMLLAGAGLLLRSFQELSRVDPGFDPSGVLSFRVSAQWAESGDRARVTQQIDRLLEGLRSLPGIQSAATSVTPPGVPTQFQQEFELVEGRAGTEPRMLAESTEVSPSYFATLRIPVAAGELCRLTPPGEPGQLMVNRRFVDRYLSGPSAVGSSLKVSRATVTQTPGSRIVGVVADARERGLDLEPAPTVYFCGFPAQPFRVFHLRTRGDPMAMAAAVRLKVKELEPLRSVYDLAPLEEWIGDAYAENRLRTLLLASFAATSLSLACVGLYGTLSYVVSLRRREVGLRLALGARRGDIVRRYVLEALRIAALACVAGLVLSTAFNHLLSGMLYGVSPADPMTLAAVVLLVLAVAALASLVPAARAALEQPMRVLRQE